MKDRKKKNGAETNESKSEGLAGPLDQVLAIGDGANDSVMLIQAGLGIAYNAKKDLDRVANAALSEANFNHIFHLLGITEEDIDEAMSCKTLG